LYVLPEELDQVESSSPSEARILAFRRAMHISVWEIRNKMLVIKDFIEATNSLKKALTIAGSLRRVKKVMNLLISLSFIL